MCTIMLSWPTAVQERRYGASASVIVITLEPAPDRATGAGAAGGGLDVGADALAFELSVEGDATAAAEFELGCFEPELAAAAATEMTIIKAISPPQPMARLRPTCPRGLGGPTQTALACGGDSE